MRTHRKVSGNNALCRPLDILNRRLHGLIRDRDLDSLAVPQQMDCTSSCFGVKHVRSGSCVELHL